MDPAVRLRPATTIPEELSANLPQPDSGRLARDGGSLQRDELELIQSPRFREETASDGNPLYNIPADFTLAPIIEAGRARVGVPGQVLHVLARHILIQQVGDGRDAERMWGVEQGPKSVSLCSARKKSGKPDWKLKQWFLAGRSPVLKTRSIGIPL